MAIAENIVKEMAARAPLNMAICTEIAEKHGLKPKSLIASASRNGIPYERKKAVSKNGAPVVSKADLVGMIAENLDVDVAALDGLDKANKAALTALVEATTDEEGEES